jgi:hypothetical protein
MDSSDEKSGTLIVDNFQGSYTIYRNGNINSGKAYEQVSGGYNPFPKPGQLTWSEAPTLIDAAQSVITDLIVAAKERVESSTVYVYAVGHTGRVYKIQVNDPSTYNPDYDNPVLLTTLSSNSPTFTRGGFIDFFGSTERIYIGHDIGVTRLDFNGTNETFIGSAGSYTASVPRPLKQFVGKLYFGNGTNIGEIDSTATVTNYAKLSPGFPIGTQVRDIEVSAEGTYANIVVTRLPLFDITSGTQETISPASLGSYIFKWNGTDIGYTSSVSYPTFSLSANYAFQGNEFNFGTDLNGQSVYLGNDRIMQGAEMPFALPNAITCSGNLLIYMSPTYFDGVLEADCFTWGSIDWEVGRGWGQGYWDIGFLNATSPETDVLRVPYFQIISNAGLGASSNNYSGNVFGTSKFYFSTVETSSGPTTKYRFYKWRIAASTNIATGTIQTNSIYQTQIQLFRKKVNINQVRIYAEPWVTDNSFQIDLVGSDGNPITGGTQTFTAGGNMTIGNDYIWWDPDMAPSYAVGLRITNLGTANHTINKVEIDYEQAGK